MKKKRICSGEDTQGSMEKDQIGETVRLPRLRQTFADALVNDDRRGAISSPGPHCPHATTHSWSGDNNPTKSDLTCSSSISYVQFECCYKKSKGDREKSGNAV